MLYLHIHKNYSDYLSRDVCCYMVYITHCTSTAFRKRLPRSFYPDEGIGQTNDTSRQEYTAIILASDPFYSYRDKTLQTYWRKQL